jgi:hypothetical protein
MSMLILIRGISGIAGLAVLVGLAFRMLPLQEPRLISGALFALFVTVAALAFWFCVRGGSERHRRAFFWSAAAAISLAVFGFILLYFASPFIWPEAPFAVPLFSLLAGSVGFVSGALVGPARLFVLAR